MKAVRVISPKNLEICEIPIPEIENKDDILIKVMSGGLCGSDIHVYHGNNPSATYPRIIGHELAGEVVRMGNGVQDLSVGDHVVIDPVISCGKCYPCSIGRPNVCSNLKALGVHTDGGFREYVVLPRKNIHKISKDMSWEEAALIEPFTVSCQVVSRGEVTDRDTVFIMGAGPIGLCILQAVKRIGAKCFTSDLLDKRLELAKSMGADAIINPSRQDVNEVIMSLTGGLGVTVVIDAACTPQTFEQAVKLTTPAGRVVILGFTNMPSKIPQFDLVSKELDVRGTRLNNNRFPEVIKWFDKKEVQPRLLISHVFHLKKEMPLWKNRILELIREIPNGTEEDIAWKLIEEMAVKGAALLKDIYDKEKGKKGRLSIQTNAKYYRNAELMEKQAIYFNTLAPNMQVKMPVTKAGVAAIEEAIYHGVSLNATVCFTVPQAVAVAEAIEQGLERREKEGKDTSSMSPVCTIMVGRLDDWIKVVANKNGIITDPGYLEWCGVAVMKNAYRIYKERGYRTRLLAAAYRNHMHWSEFIGGEVVLTIPCGWQKKFNCSDIEVIPRMDNPVDSRILNELLNKFEDFRKAYYEDGLTIDEFDTYGATARTLRGFIKGYEELLGIIRDFMLPDPDKT